MAVTIINPINNQVGASNSGITNIFTVTNSSNTASSQALIGVNVGGSTSGDPFQTFTVTGVTNWSIGIDNSASDAFVIAASAALGTTNVMTIATGGAVSIILADLDVTRSSSGASVISTISNTSNSAGSNAINQITIGGSSANQAITTYTTTGVTNWTVGVDATRSSRFGINNSSVLSSLNCISITPTTNQVSLELGNFDITHASSGGVLLNTISNTSNTAGSGVNFQATVAGASGGDAQSTYTVSGVTNWSVGVDNSDSDAFVIAASSALGSTNVIRAATSGIISYPLQPCFSAYLSGSPTNVTGDATLYVIAYDSVNYDQGSNFNTTTHAFVAPATGKYLFTGMTYTQNIGIAHTNYNILIQNLTSGFNYYLWSLNPQVQAVGGVYLNNFSNMISCAAGDNIVMSLQISGSTKTIGILGGQAITLFEGFKVA